MAVAAAGMREPSALAALVVDRARDLLGTEAAALYWWFPETGLLQTMADNDPDSAPPEPPFRPGEGAAGRAFQTAEPIRVDDYANWEAALPTSVQRGIASGMAVPLMVSHRAVGALGVFSNRLRSWQDDEEQLLLLLAAQVAPALEAARLTEATNQQAHNFRALHEVAIAAGGLHDLRELGRLVVDRARQLLKTESATLRWWDPTTQSLRLLAGSDAREEGMDRIKSGEGTLGQAFERREPIVIEGEFAVGSGAWALPEGVRAALAVPVMARDEPLGAIGVATGLDRRFTRDEIQLLTLLAAQFGPALEAARLYSESERRRCDAEALAELVREGANQVDLKGVIATITDHACRLLGADYTAVAMLDEQGNLELRGSHGTRSELWREGRRVSPTGLAAQVVEHQRTLIVTDIGGRAEFPGHKAEGGQAAVATPLLESGKLVGAIMLGWRENIQPNADQVRLVEALAGYAATIIDNARTHERERALANEAATRSAELAAVIDHIPDAVYVADLEGRVVLVNQAAAEMMGVGPGELSPEPADMVLLDALTGQPIPPEKFAIRQALGGWKVARRETIVQRPGFPDLRLASSAVPIRDAEGTLKGGLVVFSDVTRERKLLGDLAASEAKYRLLFDKNPEAMWVRERGTARFLAVNDAAVKRYGWTREEFLAMPLDALQPPEELARLRESRGNADVYSGPWRHLRKDGSIIAVEITAHPIEFGGRDARLVIAANVSDRKRAEKLLVESEQQRRTIFDQAPIGLARVDLQGSVQAANLALCTMLGLTDAEIVGLPLASVLRQPGSDSEDTVGEFIRSGHDHFAAEFAIHRGDGTVRWGSASLSMVRGPEHEPLYLIGMLEDITDRRAKTEQLEYLALHDSLTDLPNRTLFDDRLAQAIMTAHREHRRLVLLILDLNGFKEVNDTYGHQLGDALLQQVGPRLAAQLRESDTLARLGGDEFAVVLPTADDEAGAALAAERILKALEEPFTVDGRRLEIGGSIGIAIAPDHGSDSATLMRRADVAMYAAKRSRSRFAIFSPEHDRLSPTRLVLMGELSEAIPGSQLAVHFQPQVGLADHRVVGIEVLVRWRHPRHGLMPPEHFLDLADESGLTAGISEWALEAGLAQARSWAKHGEIPLAVNLSVQNLADAGLADHLTNALARWSLPPARLKLEITERALTGDGRRHAPTLAALRERGMRVSIDDFGTGSLAAEDLRRLPVDEIKIDRSLIADLSSGARQLATVRAAIQLAHELGLPVVAEGVETEAAWQVLADLGCDVLQGFLVSRPMAARQLGRWLAAGLTLPSAPTPQPKR